MIQYLSQWLSPKPPTNSPTSSHPANLSTQIPDTPPTLVRRQNPAHLNTSQPEYMSPRQKQQFQRTQTTEQLINYSAGGMVEGLGKFLQREGRHRYLEHPLAKSMFTPFLTAMTRLAETTTGHELDSEELEKVLQQFGSWGMGAGNLIKVSSNIWALIQFKRMAKGSQDSQILKKISQGNSLRNIFYLAEKASFTTAGALYMVGDNYPSIAFMLLAQTAVLANAYISMKANGPVIRKFWNNPTDMDLFRDASKITGLNLAKGIWASATLGVVTYLTAVPPPKPARQVATFRETQHHPNPNPTKHDRHL